MAKLQDELLKKKKLYEEEEKIEMMAKPGKEGIENTREIMKAEEKEEEEEHNTELERLDKQSRRGRIINYNFLLAELLLKRLSYNYWPFGWTYKAVPDRTGVIMEIASPKKRYFRSAFKPTGLSLYDLNAIDTYALRAQNTVDRITGEDKAWTSKDTKSLSIK